MFVIIPVMHIAHALFDKRRLTLWCVVGIFLQTAVLFFAFHNRTTAAWGMVAFLVLATVAIVLAWPQARRALLWRRLVIAGAVIVVFATGVEHVTSRIHPVAEIKGQVTRHTLWTSAYCALTHHGDWLPKYSEYHEGTQCEDAARIAAAKYFERNPSPEFEAAFDPKTKGFRNHAALDTFVRKAYFEMVEDDPTYVLETLMLVNPYRVGYMVSDGIVHMVESYLETGRKWSHIGGVILVAAIVLAGGFLGSSWRSWRRGAVASGIALGLTVVSGLPNMLVLVLWDSLIDSYILAFVAMCTLAVFALATVFRVAMLWLERIRDTHTTGPVAH